MLPIHFQDTVIGIQALAKLGEQLATKNNSISVMFTYEGGGQSQMNINPDNSMILQKQIVGSKYIQCSEILENISNVQLFSFQGKRD